VLGEREPHFLHDKAIGLISVAGGTQGLQAINTMEFAVRALPGWAVPYVVPVAAAARVFDQEGRIQDQAVESQLKTLGNEVVRVAERFAEEARITKANAIVPPSESRRSLRAPRRQARNDFVVLQAR
jgi:hypothetical protein